MEPKSTLNRMSVFSVQSNHDYEDIDRSDTDMTTTASSSGGSGSGADAHAPGLASPNSPSSPPVRHEIVPRSALPDLNIPLSHIEVGEELGRGNFGCVRAGWMQDGRGMKTRVAVKSVLPDAPDEALTNLREEGDVMNAASLVPHENILKLLAIVDSPPTYYLVLEYCGLGSLHSYLVKCRSENETLSLSAQIGFAVQIAKGMESLAQRNIIHRDLAARNVLLTNQMMCKISGEICFFENLAIK